jgi:hypothetical protein
MPSNSCNRDQILFNGIKSILNNSELKTFEKMILIVIKVYQVEYGDVFPDYDTMAAAGGMCKRKAQYVVKDLQARNMIEKFPRFKDLADGSRKQTSNRYIIVNEQTDSSIVSDAHDAPNAQHAPATDSSCAQYAPYNAGFNYQDSFAFYTSTKNKEDEDEYITREREIESKKYACYAEVYKHMIQDQGTGVLSYKQTEFLDACISYNLPACLVNELYPHVRDAIQKYHYLAIPRTFEKFATRLAKKRIDNPIAWFVTTFRNEDLKVRTELQMQAIGKVG